jgi:hypothetical protein
VIQPPPPGTAPCLADTDCAPAGPTQVCAQVSCDLASGMMCIPGCASAADCAEGEACSPAHHCVPQPCGAGCPPLFACDAATSVCLRLACKRDPDCPAKGVCVDSQCHSALGQCGLID